MARVLKTDFYVSRGKIFDRKIFWKKRFQNFFRNKFWNLVFLLLFYLNFNYLRCTIPCKKSSFYCEGNSISFETWYFSKKVSGDLKQKHILYKLHQQSMVSNIFRGKVSRHSGKRQFECCPVWCCIILKQYAEPDYNLQNHHDKLWLTTS